MPDVPAQSCVLRAPVPEGIFTLAIEADDAAAAAEHAAFADRCRPLLLRAVELRPGLLGRVALLAGGSGGCLVPPWLPHMSGAPAQTARAV